MTTSSNTLSRQISYVLSGRIVSFVLMFFIPVILVRIFSQEVFGLYRQFFLVFYAAFTLLQLGMSVSLSAFIPRNREHADSIVAAAVFLLGIIGCLCALVGGGAQWLFDAHPLFRLGLVLGVFTGLMIASSPFEHLLLLEEKSRATAVLIIVWDFARGGLLLLAAMGFQDLSWALWMMTFAAFLRLAAMIAYIRERYSLSIHKISWKLLKKQLSEASSLTLQAGAHLVEINVDRYIVMFFFTASSFAVYTVGAFQLPIVDMLFSSVCGVLLPRLSGLCAEGKMDELIELYRDSIRKMLLALLPLSGLLFTVRFEFITTLFSARYVESVSIFAVFVWIIPTYAILSALVLQAVGHNRFLFISSVLKVCLAVAMVGAGYVLGGMLGVVIGLVAYHFVAAILLFYFTLLALKAPLYRVFPIRAALQWSVVLLVSTGFVEWSFTFWSLPTWLGLFLKPLAFLVSFCGLIAVLGWLPEDDEKMLKDWSARLLAKCTSRTPQTLPSSHNVEPLTLEGVQQ